MIRIGASTDDDLDRVAAASSSDQPTYPSEIAATEYRREEWNRQLPPAVSWEDAKQALREWRAHRGAGIRLRPTDPPHDGQTVALDIGVGPVHLIAVCRVTATVDDAFGFTYAALPGHPEVGEESFTLRRGDDCVITFRVTALSRSGDTVARLGGPVTRKRQQRITRRYLHLDRLA